MTASVSCSPEVAGHTYSGTGEVIGLSAGDPRLPGEHIKPCLTGSNWLIWKEWRRNQAHFILVLHGRYKHLRKDVEPFVYRVPYGKYLRSSWRESVIVNWRLPCSKDITLIKAKQKRQKSTKKEGLGDVNVRRRTLHVLLACFERHSSHLCMRSGYVTSAWSKHRLNHSYVSIK